MIVVPGGTRSGAAVPRRVPREQIGLYLLLGYIPAPQTIWRDISQVVPGGWVRLRRDVLDGGVYWRAAKSEIGNPKPEFRMTNDVATDGQV